MFKRQQATTAILELYQRIGTDIWEIPEPYKSDVLAILDLEKLEDYFNNLLEKNNGY